MEILSSCSCQKLPNFCFSLASYSIRIFNHIQSAYSDASVFKTDSGFGNFSLPLQLQLWSKPPFSPTWIIIATASWLVFLLLSLPPPLQYTLGLKPLKFQARSCYIQSLQIASHVNKHLCIGIQDTKSFTASFPFPTSFPSISQPTLAFSSNVLHIVLPQSLGPCSSFHQGPSSSIVCFICPFFPLYFCSSVILSMSTSFTIPSGSHLSHFPFLISLSF